MFGTREFRFSYTVIETGETHYVMARNIWLANKALIAHHGEGFKDLKRAPFPKKERLTTGHCQICAREIGTTVGLIAHHGYTRPGHGWQTASCFGARWRPYEVACDALPEAIRSLEAYVETLKESIERWLATPPEKITYTRGSFKKETVELARPADFDPTVQPRISEYGTYARHFHSQIAEWRCWSSNAQDDIKRLQQRLADWKAPRGGSDA